MLLFTLRSLLGGVKPDSSKPESSTARVETPTARYEQMFMTNAGAALLLLPAAFPALALILGIHCVGFCVEVCDFWILGFRLPGIRAHRFNAKVSSVVSRQSVCRKRPQSWR